MYVNVNGEELPVYQYVDPYGDKEKLCRPSCSNSRLTVSITTDGVYTKLEEAENDTSLRGI